MTNNAPRHLAAPSFRVALRSNSPTWGVHSVGCANKNGPGREARAAQMLNTSKVAAHTVLKPPGGLLARKALPCPHMPIGREVNPEPTPQE
jgi:hypothetical protein